MEGPSKVFRRSLLKQLANQAAIIFISAQVVGGLGCSSPRPSAQAQISAPLQSGELNPVQAWNKYLGVLAEGDKEALRASIYLHPGTNEQARLDASIAVLGSSADLRRAFDRAYGSGRLATLGFHCFSPGAQLPQQTTFKIEGDHATASTGRDSIGLVRDGDTWKEDFLP